MHWNRLMLALEATNSHVGKRSLPLTSTQTVSPFSAMQLYLGWHSNTFPSTISASAPQPPAGAGAVEHLQRHASENDDRHLQKSLRSLKELQQLLATEQVPRRPLRGLDILRPEDLAGPHFGGRKPTSFGLEDVSRIGAPPPFEGLLGMWHCIDSFSRVHVSENKKANSCTLPKMPSGSTFAWAASVSK